MTHRPLGLGAGGGSARWGTGFCRGNRGSYQFRGFALAAALLMGRRKGFGKEPMAPHNLPMTITGVGFSGSAGLVSMPERHHCRNVKHKRLCRDSYGRAAGALSWALVEWIYKGKPTTLGIASGAVAGWPPSHRQRDL